MINVKRPGFRSILNVGLGLLTALPTWASPTPPPPASPKAMTLADCFQEARKISESVGISAENTRRQQYEYRAELSSILPHISWVMSRFYQEKVSNTNGTTSSTGSGLLSSQPLSYFQLQQPIFAGFRDWRVMEIAKSQTRQAELNQTSTDLQLLSDVATAFYAAYTFQDALSILMEIRKLNQDQVDQLNHWVDIGRARPSELLSAQTQLASLDAQIEETKRQVAETRHLLFFLTGVPAEVPLVDEGMNVPHLTVQEALTRASKRPDLQSAVEDVHQGDLAIRYAKGAYLPTLGFLGRYYTERVGFQEDIDWDVNFTLDVPIYQGGQTRANVQSARSQQIIADLNLRRLKRSVDRDVRTAHEDLIRALSEYQAYDKAVQLAQKNYTAQKGEFARGVITNLDLLRLLTDMQTIRRDWLISRANARLDEVRLKIAMGEGL
jgi:outer membrane protein